MNTLDLLERLDIEYKREGHEHCRPGWAQTDCPKCDLTNHWRLGWNISNGYCHCWSCGKINSAWALSELSKRNYHEIKHLLSRLILDNTAVEAKARGNLELPNGLTRLLKPHKDYLRSRRFNPREIEGLWNVQGIGLSSKLAWRLFIPIIYKGKCVSWTTRSLSDEHSLRYLSAEASQEAISKSELLYGEDLATHTIIVLEGPLDVWAVGRGAVATLGTGYSSRQVYKMSKYSTRIVCFDAEAAAQRRAINLCRQLEAFPGKTINVVLDSGKDPSRASQRELAQLRRMLF